MAENQEELESTQEEQDTSTSDTLENTSEEETDDIPQDENTSDTDEKTEELSFEDLESMTDEEFDAYLETGQKPHSKSTFSDRKEETLPNSQKIKTDVSNPTHSEVSEQKSGSQRNRKSTADNKPDTASNTSEQADTTETTPVDYKAFYESVLKPFKANGKEVTPRNMEDVISLMQMGANYTKKMQTIAPMRKVVETLNKADINEEQLNFLIDVHKGNKEAIKKLLTDHKVDPLELDMESTNYVANRDNIASDKEVEFSELLMDISESVPKIKEILSNNWDTASKDELFSNPKLLRALHEEIQMGRFDIVQKQLESERMFGRYKGMNDLRAYSAIVTEMVKAEQEKQSKTKASTANITDTQVNTSVTEKKKAAAPNKAKAKAKSTTMSPKDLWDLPDDEFDKLNLKDIV